MKNKYRYLMALSALVVAVAPAHAQIVKNGDFESSTGNQQCAADWTCSRTKYFGVEPVSFWNGQIDGSDLAPSPNGGNVLIAYHVDGVDSISQTLTGLNAGTSYTLTYTLADADRQTVTYGPGTMSWIASIGGTVLNTAANPGTIAIAGPQSATPWTTVSYNFVANASSEVLQFLASSSVPVAPEPILALDGVKVVTAPIPEPGTYALLAAGLAAVGVVARRRSRAAR